MHLSWFLITWKDPDYVQEDVLYFQTHMPEKTLRTVASDDVSIVISGN